MKVAVKYLYKEIEYVATTIWRLGLTNRLVEAAKSQNFEEMEEILKEFKIHHSEFWQRIQEFYKDYEEEGCPIIFSKDAMQYEGEKVKAINLICLCAISNGEIRPEDFFQNIKYLKEELCEEGYTNIANEILRYRISTLNMLMKTFKPK